MNQKIIKLVRQTLNECVSTPVESVIASSIDDHGIVEIPNTFAEKFAELIVKQCMDICQELVDDGLSEAETSKWKIEEHFFGVKE